MAGFETEAAYSNLLRALPLKERAIAKAIFEDERLDENDGFVRLSELFTFAMGRA